MAKKTRKAVIVTTDEPLAELFQSACDRRKIVAEHVTGIEESRKHWLDESAQLIGVVGDSAVMGPQQKYELIRIHCEPAAPRLIVLDPPQVPDPRAPLEVITRVRWPLNAAFADALKELTQSMIFLADNTLFLTGMLRARLAAVGLEPLVLESDMGISQALQPSKGGPPPCAIIPWSGDAFDATPVQQRVAQNIPDIRVFLVTSAGAVHTAERALRKMRPAFLPRDLVEHAIDVFLDKQANTPNLGRVILIEKDRVTLMSLATKLILEGYEVSAHLTTDEAFEQVRSDRYHVAVVGAALAHARETGVDIAKKMRSLDPDLRFVLMVEDASRAAFRGVGQIAELGLDDVVLKPASEAERLEFLDRTVFAVKQALERRNLEVQNRQLLEDLRVMNDELEQLTGFQKKFFAMVAHDVKNPLTAIRGYAELLSWKVKDEQLVKCVTHIQSSSKTLEGLISDLVDLAAIESGKLRINMEQIDLLQVITEVSSRIQVAADNRKMAFKVSVPESLPTMKGDPLRLGQVIQNLCTNAIQYTPEKGAVYLKVQLTPGMVTVSVRDTGIGISKEDLPRVFERFFQAQNAQKMRRAGFGLGLMISQEIVKTHGGSMGVDSELGKGSVFYFNLPLPDTSGPEAQAAAMPAAPSMQGQHTPMPRRIQTPPPRQVETPKTPPPGTPGTPPPKPLDPDSAQFEPPEPPKPQ